MTEDDNKTTTRRATLGLAHHLAASGQRIAVLDACVECRGPLVDMDLLNLLGDIFDLRQQPLYERMADRCEDHGSALLTKELKLTREDIESLEREVSAARAQAARVRQSMEPLRAGVAVGLMNDTVCIEGGCGLMRMDKRHADAVAADLEGDAQLAAAVGALCVKHGERLLRTKWKDAERAERTAARHYKDHPELLEAARRLNVVVRKEGLPEKAQQLFKPSLLLMALGVFFQEAVVGRSKEDWPAGRSGHKHADELLTRLIHAWSSEHTSFLVGFSSLWAAAAFPVIRTGARQAAAMMLTEPPVGIVPPWDACAITVPDGLLSLRGVPVRHLLCLEAPHEKLKPRIAPVGPDGLLGVDEASEVSKADHETLTMVGNLHGSLYAALEAKTHIAQESYRGRSRHRNRGYREAPPPGTAYVVKAPVSIDLRQTVRELSNGTGGRRPTVQFVVRGHWRNQAHGRGMSLRRMQWIEPFWKGPKDAVAAIKAYKVSDD